MTNAPPVQRLSHLDPHDIAAVRELTEAAGDADGVYPLSEHVTLHLRHGGERDAVHLLLRYSLPSRGLLRLRLTPWWSAVWRSRAA